MFIECCLQAVSVCEASAPGPAVCVCTWCVCDAILCVCVCVCCGGNISSFDDHPFCFKWPRFYFFRAINIWTLFIRGPSLLRPPSLHLSSPRGDMTHQTVWTAELSPSCSRPIVSSFNIWITGLCCVELMWRVCVCVCVTSYLKCPFGREKNHYTKASDVPVVFRMSFWPWSDGLVVQLAEQRRRLGDPVVAGPVGGQQHRHHEVSGVTWRRRRRRSSQTGDPFWSSMGWSGPELSRCPWAKR